jgi:predicted nucleic acid-binding protein
MRLMLDLNVLLDMVQRREPFYAASIAVVDRVFKREVSGCLPAHALTTLHYIIRKFAGKDRADETVDWLLSGFEIIPQDKPQFLRARTLAFSDFEDSVVASAAEAGGCDWIVTRNVADFDGSPIAAVTPEEFLFRS